MPVLNRQERLAGTLSFGDIGLADAAGSAGNALCDIPVASTVSLWTDATRWRL